MSRTGTGRPVITCPRCKQDKPRVEFRQLDCHRLAASCRECEQAARRRRVLGLVVCRECGQAKPKEEFTRRKNGQVRNHRCKACLALVERRRGLQRCGDCVFLERCRNMIAADQARARRYQNVQLDRGGVEVPCFPVSIYPADFLSFYGEEIEDEITVTADSIPVDVEIFELLAIGD